MLVWSVPITEGELYTDGLQQPVEITCDSMGIPQIWAADVADGYFALGYQHAADRLFQMELTRRIAQGRLSEMLGRMTYDLDVQQRHIGHSRLALAAVDSLSESNRQVLRAYCDGINAYADQCRALPFEFRLVPIEFEPWSPYDCLSVLSYLTWFSNALMASDRFHLELYEKLGQEAAGYLPSYPDWAPVTVGSKSLSSSVSSPNVDLGTLTMTNIRELACQPVTVGGSNAWAVSPNRSQSGRAMLAADPHLEVGRLPQFWYAVGLHLASDSTNVLGITIPGLPLVVMGHNGQAAWAFTVGGIDVTDYYREQLNPEDSLQYLTVDGYQNFELIVDSIPIAREALPAEITIRTSHHGPVMLQADDDGSVYSMRWAGFDADLNAALTSGLELRRVANFAGFCDLATNMAALDASWIYADSGGNIGYQLGTPIANRDRMTAAFPQDGWTGEHEWQGYRPPYQTPRTNSPDQGWVASCNNLPQRSDDLFGTFAFDRIARIGSLLDEYERFTPAQMQAMQLDSISTHWLRWKPALAEAVFALGDTLLARRIQTWSGDCGTDSEVAPLMAKFLQQLKRLAYADELGELAGSASRALIETELSEADSSMSEMVLGAAREAVNFSTGRKWGEIQSLRMRHPMSAVPVLTDLLDLERGPWPWGGTPGTLNASWYQKHSDSTYQTVVGASWRFVIDFADPDAATMVLPAGNSGNPMSDHFFDFFDRYRTGGRWTVPLSREKVYARTKDTLTLIPYTD